MHDLQRMVVYEKVAKQRKRDNVATTSAIFGYRYDHTSWGKKGLDQIGIQRTKNYLSIHYCIYMLLEDLKNCFRGR